MFHVKHPNTRRQRRSREEGRGQEAGERRGREGGKAKKWKEQEEREAQWRCHDGEASRAKTSEKAQGQKKEGAGRAGGHRKSHRVFHVKHPGP